MIAYVGPYTCQKLLFLFGKLLGDKVDVVLNFEEQLFVFDVALQNEIVKPRIQVFIVRLVVIVELVEFVFDFLSNRVVYKHYFGCFLLQMFVIFHRLVESFQRLFGVVHSALISAQKSLLLFCL